MAIAFKLNMSSLSDAEVIRRAGELGYVKAENETLVNVDTENDMVSDEESDDTETDVKSEKDDSSGKETEEDEETVKDDKKADKEENADDEASESESDDDNTVEEEEEEETKPTVTETNYVSFQILPGEFSDVVSEKLESQGLVENAEAYNEFLIDNGYDSFIQPGSFEIPEGASAEEIARILMTKSENR